MVPMTLAALCHLVETGLDCFINSWWHSAWGWQSQTGHRKRGGGGSNDIPNKPRGLKMVFLSQSSRHYFLPWLRNKGKNGGGYFRGQGSQGPFRLTSFVMSCSTIACTGALGLTDENKMEEPLFRICGVAPLRECLPWTQFPAPLKCLSSQQLGGRQRKVRSSRSFLIMES